MKVEAWSSSCDVCVAQVRLGAVKFKEAVGPPQQQQAHSWWVVGGAALWWTSAWAHSLSV